MTHVEPRFIWRDWPEGSVIFDRLRGDTHTLSFTVAAVFRALLADVQANDRCLYRQLELECVDVTAEQRVTLIEDARLHLIQSGLV